MATQFCLLGFVDVVTELKQRALMAEEGRARLQEQEQPHLPEFFRKRELIRHESRIRDKTTRNIDLLIEHAYKHNQQYPYPAYQPYMVEDMVSKQPFGLAILLDDIRVFLQFERGAYLKFWQDVETRVKLTVFTHPETNQSIRTQYASLQSRPKFESYWPC